MESEEGKGTTFRLIFPLGKNHLKSKEICQEKIEKNIERKNPIPELEEFLKAKLSTKLVLNSLISPHY